MQFVDIRITPKDPYVGKGLILMGGLRRMPGQAISGLINRLEKFAASFHFCLSVAVLDHMLPRLHKHFLSFMLVGGN